MAGIIESFYWLVTGRDYETDKRMRRQAREHEEARLQGDDDEDDEEPTAA